MEEELVINKSVRLHAEVLSVWDALTNPEITKKYMLGTEVISDWKEGSSLKWINTSNGSEIIEAKGKVLSFEPWNLLVYTMIDPNAGYADVQENYVTATFHLAEEDVHTMLTLMLGDFSRVAEGMKRYNESFGSWDAILQDLKYIVELQTT